jgi:hypothetical protein
MVKLPIAFFAWQLVVATCTVPTELTFTCANAQHAKVEHQELTSRSSSADTALPSKHQEPGRQQGSSLYAVVPMLKHLVTAFVEGVSLAKQPAEPSDQSEREDRPPALSRLPAPQCPPANNAAFPPAAAVLIVNVCSAAKR